MTRKFLVPALVSAIFAMSCGNQEQKSSDTASATDTVPSIKEENVRYSADTSTLNGFIVYDANAKNPQPVVLIVHEWWGLNDYVKNRARQLANMGYVAMAVDMFGNGRNAANPQEAQAMVTPFYTNPQLMKTRFDAALNKVKEYKQADTGNIAAIGYCFGGSVVLNTAKMGSPLNGVVSFHGGLEGVTADKNLLKAKILVCHGEADSFVPADQITTFRKQLDSIGADYTFKTYPGATHAFTNPGATEAGKRFNIPIAYNGAADTASWNDMKSFFGTIFTRNTQGR